MREEWFVPARQNKEFAQNKSAKETQGPPRNGVSIYNGTGQSSLRNVGRAEQNWLVS